MSKTSVTRKRSRGSCCVGGVSICFRYSADTCKSPNDPKLSDGGAWRGSCEGGAQKEATDVGQRWLGGKTPKPESAATVTRGAVRCSAWLGVRLDSEKASNKSLETVALAGDDRVTGDGKLAPAERMGATKDQSRRLVERRAMTGDEKPAPTGVVIEPRGSAAALAADVEREASAGQDARNSEQTGRGRGIG